MLKIANKLKVFLLANLLVSSVFANSIHVQGRLTDKNGNPRKSATAKLKFEIYPAENGSTSIWIKEYEGLKTNDAGLFATDIGPFVKDFFKSDQEYFLQISVDDFGWQILKPRQKLSSVPFAIGSDYAAISSTTLSVAHGAVSSDSIQDNAIKAYHIGQREIHGVHIATGSISKEHLEDESVTKAKIQSGAVGTEQIGDGAITKEKMGFNFVTTRYIDTMWIEGTWKCSDGKMKKTYVISLPEIIKGSALGMIGELKQEEGIFEKIAVRDLKQELAVDVVFIPNCPAGGEARFKALVHLFEVQRE